MQAAASADRAGPADSRLDYTDHAMLVVWGQFARQIGLLKGLREVPVDQKTVAHCPQTKLVQLLVAILAGCAHLWDMRTGPNPLVKDQTVAAAWDQPAWADPSGVSRTFRSADVQTVAATLAVLQQVSQPFIDREVLLALRQQQILQYDADLTGREVSKTSRDYPDVAFGWMGDHLGLGYQAAIVSMASPTYGRLLLTGRRHPGNTASSECLQELVRAAEGVTDVRPQRRTDLVSQRLAELTATLDHQRQQADRAVARANAAEILLREAEPILVERREGLQQSGIPLPPARPDGVTRRVLTAQRRYEAAVETVARRERAVALAAAWAQKQQRLLAELEEGHAGLTTHLSQLEADNATNIAPIRAIFRMDAGFGSGPNVAWLIEMGYDVYTKAHNAEVTAQLRVCKPAAVPWARVGKNAEIWMQTETTVTNCPYPLDAALERFQTGETVRYGTLLHAGRDPVVTDPVGWFQAYNRRQTIEAGIKENKGVFQMRHFKLRSCAGLALGEAFALFAANFVRWAAIWLGEQSAVVPAPFGCSRPRVPVKQLVRTAANTSAWVVQQPPRGVVVSFTERSPFAGVQLVLGSDGFFQPPLPLFKCLYHPP